MKNLIEIVKSIRQGVLEGIRISRSDISHLPLELVEEVSGARVEIYSDKVHEIPVHRSVELRREIYALDSSSRAIEAPYMFISVGAGSVFNRFTGFALDVPSLSSIMGLEEPICNHIVLIPEIECSQRLLSSLRAVKSLIHTNPNNIPYTSEYNRGLILVELRANIENCLLENFARVSREELVLFIDGPIIYPEKVIELTSASRGMLEIYVNSIRTLNVSRVKLIKKLISQNVVVVNIVKRLQKSYYLSSIDPLDLKITSVSDDAYLTIALIAGKVPLEKPVAIGPLIVRHPIEQGISRAMWYVIIPRRLHSSMSGLGSYVFYRIEVLEELLREPVLELVAQDSVQIGSFLPLTLLVVDKRVKRISSSVTTYFLYLTGLPSEATEHYISIL